MVGRLLVACVAPPFECCCSCHNCSCCRFQDFCCCRGGPLRVSEENHGLSCWSVGCWERKDL